MQKKVHFLGIGGSGTSAAAAIAEAQGFCITGCDLQPYNEFTQSFKNSQLFTGHNPNHLASQPTSGSINLLVVTPAIFSLDPNNHELTAARRQNIPVVTWQQFVGEYLAQDKVVISVCGTHGKTTTTAMIAKILEDAKLDPTVLLGAIIPKWKRNYRIGKGKYFIVEADEFNDNFLSYKPTIIVVTNIEMDHPEYFKDFETYKQSFGKFFSQTADKIIANLSDPGISKVLASHPRGGSSIIDYSNKLINFPLQVPGQHNILNASAAYQVGLYLKIDPEIIKKSLMSYTGAERRFEKMGEFKGIEVYSDFAHHPTEIKVTLETARTKFPNQKITVIFQPHMFSRTHALFDDFVKVLQNAPVDQIFIMDIYASREKDAGLVNSKQLVEAVHQKRTKYIPTEEKILAEIYSKVKPKEVLFFLGAGDTHNLAKKLIQ